MKFYNEERINNLITLSGYEHLKSISNIMQIVRDRANEEIHGEIGYYCIDQCLSELDGMLNLLQIFLNNCTSQSDEIHCIKCFVDTLKVRFPSKDDKNG